MKMELTDEKRKGYVVCALMILVSCLYLVYLGYSLYRKHSASCVFFSPLFLPTFVASL